MNCDISTSEKFIYLTESCIYLLMILEKIYTRIGKRFVVVIPKEIREQVNMQEGEPISIKIDGMKLILELERVDPFQQMSEIAGDIIFDRQTRKKTEEFALNLVKEDTP